MKISFRSFLFCSIFISQNFISAQTLGLKAIPTDEMQFGFNFNKSFYSHYDNVSAFSGLFELNWNIPLSSKLNIVGEIPYINTNYETNYSFGNYNYNFKYSRNGIGNIFVGMQTKSADDESKSIATFGIYLPTADEEAAYTALFSNYYDIQKFVPKSFGLYFNYAHHKIFEGGFRYGFEFGPNIIIPTESGYSETELFIHYAGTVGYQVNKLQVNIEFLGIGILTQSVDNFWDRLIHQFGIGAFWKESFITPKIFYRIYLRDEISNMIDGILGIGVIVSID